MASGIIFDETGTVHSLTAEFIARTLCTDRDPNSLVHCLTDQMGFIHVEPNAACPVVWLHKGHTTAAAIVGCCMWLLDGQHTRAIIFDTSVPDQPAMLSSLNGALQLLSDMADQKRSIDDHIRHKIPLAGSWFSTTWSAANELVKAPISDDVRFAILDKLFAGHFTMAVQNAASGQFVAKHMGSAIGQYRQSMCRVQVGQPFAAMQAQSYGAWLSKGFQALRPDTPPHAEQIDAAIGVDKRSIERLRYQRLVVPFVSGGVQHVLTASVVEG